MRVETLLNKTQPKVFCFRVFSFQIINKNIDVFQKPLIEFSMVSFTLM